MQVQICVDMYMSALSGFEVALMTDMQHNHKVRKTAEHMFKDLENNFWKSDVAPCFVYQKNPHASKSKGEYNTADANKQDANDMQAELMPTDALQ